MGGGDPDNAEVFNCYAMMKIFGWTPDVFPKMKEATFQAVLRKMIDDPEFKQRPSVDSPKSIGRLGR